MSDKEVVSVTTWASSRWRFSPWANIGFPRIRPVAWGRLPPVGTFSFPVAQRLLYASKPLDDAVFADRQAPTLINCRDTANQCPVIGHCCRLTFGNERQQCVLLLPHGSGRGLSGSYSFLRTHTTDPYA